MENFAGAASAAPPLEPLLKSSRLSVANPHAGVELVSFAPGDDLQAAADAKALFDRVLTSPDGQRFLDGYLGAELFESHGMLVVARHGRSVLGTLRFREIEPGELLIQSVAVSRRHAGMKLASAMTALAIQHGRLAFGDAQHITCTIRAFGDGGLNDRSHASFTRLGFALEAQMGKHVIVGTYRDRHQYRSAEIEDGRAIIRFLWMSAGPEIYPIARRFLAGWSNAVFAQSLPKRRG